MDVLFLIVVGLLVFACFLAEWLWASRKRIRKIEAELRFSRKASENHRVRCDELLSGVSELKAMAEDSRHNEKLYDREHEANIHKWYRDKLAKILEQE